MSREISPRDRARYRIDNLFSRGTPALILGLAVLSAVVVVVVAAVVWLLRISPAGEGRLTFAESVWRSLVRTLDPGTMGADLGWGFRFAMLAVTVGGIFVISTLIGVLTAGVEGKLASLRKGRSRIVERDHTVILGWSEQVFTIIAELVTANENRRRPCVAVLGARDKVAMEDEIREKLPERKNTRVVCRTGDPMEMADLAIASVDTARSIIVLSPECAHADAEVLKIVLAIIHRPGRRPEPYHIVAALRDPRNAAVAAVVGRDEVEWILVGDLVARVIAQTCRQSGLSTVYTELLDFGGDEIYFTEVPDLHGRTFGEALGAFETNAVMGLAPRDGAPLLNPPMDTVLRAGDQLVVIAEDDDRIDYRAVRALVDETAVVVAPPRRPSPERTLVLGWNWRGCDILRELDNYAPAGSDALVVAEAPEVGVQLATCESLEHLRLAFEPGDTSDREVLERLTPARFDHIIVLSCADDKGAQEADAGTLMTLVHLRDMADRQGVTFPIVSEMLDLRNRRLAEVTRADDFVVSDHLVSLMLTQVSENKQLNAVFADIFDAEGSEIYLRPARDYVVDAREVTYATVVEAARRRGECAIGYRLAALAHDAAQAWGVVVNPAKSSAVRLSDDDKVIVVAED
jgi:voltage-gated potassium channel Kch